MPADANNDLATQAVALWEQIAGRKVDATSYVVQMTEASREINVACDLIRSVVCLDDGFSTVLVVRSIFERLSGAGLLEGRSPEAAAALAQLLGKQEVTASTDEYFSYCKRAVAHYRGGNVDGDALAEFVRQQAPLLNLDAFLAMNRLTKLTAFAGEPGHAHEPQLSRFVLAFQTLDQLLQHARVIPEGFSLCAILCESISDSYFVLVVRNGQQVTLLTDKGTFAHPLQQEMMRGRNDRYNQSRIEGSHFPYSLLRIVWADNGRRAVANSARDLVPTERDVPSIGSLSDLAPDELLWLHLLIEQCRIRYFQQKQVEPGLALGSQLQIDHAWLPSQSSNLPAILEGLPHLEVKNSSDLSTDFMHTLEPKWSEKRTPNRWMERRFAAAVPQEALYIPEAAMNNKPLLLEQTSSAVRLDRKKPDYMPHGGLTNQVRLTPISSDLLATSEQVARDAHFVARSNQAEVIKVLARQDFEARRIGMLEWFYRKAKKNLPNLLEALLTGDSTPFQLEQPKFEHLYSQLGFRPAGAAARRKVQFEYIPSRKQHPPRKSDGPSLAKTLKLVHLRDLCVCCVLSNCEGAQVFISVPVANALDIANLTGIAWEKLPEELQYFGMPEVGGNSILERLDPLQNLSNPWNSFAPRFVIPVGLRGLREYRKARGLNTPSADELKNL
ncbi:TPA: hypothetical protein ACQTYG_006192 [Pseudomonas aeruginosa]